jgi:hypothetical protein
MQSLWSLASFFLFVLFSEWFGVSKGSRRDDLEGAKRSTAQHCAIYRHHGVSTASRASTQDTESLYGAKYPVIWNFFDTGLEGGKGHGLSA